MKVNDVKAIGGVERAKSGEGPSPQVGRTRDRVSTDASREVSEAVFAAKSAQGDERATRLERVEAAVRSGTFVPNAARLAEQILADAEIEARLQAMLRH